MTIGLVSDTHGYFEPKLKTTLAGVELILHAGDVGREPVLEELREIAPVQAVRGNVDSPHSGLPLTLQLAPGSAGVHVLHVLPASQPDLEAWAEAAGYGRPIPKAADRLVRAFEPSTEVVLFGHSHRPCAVSMGGILWINPGSAGRKRFSLPRTCGLLEVSANELDARILPLEDDGALLPPHISVRRKARA
jgi:uncharacterized protein